MILCRDLAIHLSLADIHRLLANFAASGARLLLIIHVPGYRENTEILSGDFHAVNLTRPPFGWPNPIEVIAEQSRLAERALGLWVLSPSGWRGTASRVP